MVARNRPVPRHTVHVAGCPVRTTVTSRPAVVRRWMYVARWLQRHRLYSDEGLTVGLGLQWTPAFRALPAGHEPRPGTLQLCAGNQCLIFQLARAGGAVPRILRRFLADRRVTFAAYNVASDCRKLLAHHGLRVASTLELHGAAGMGNSSMEAMAEKLLGFRGLVGKSRKVGTSRWDGPTLSTTQVRYACEDAYLSCRLGEEVRRRRRVMVMERQAQDESDDDWESMESEASCDHGDWEAEDRFVGYAAYGYGIPDEEDDREVLQDEYMDYYY